MIDWAWSPNLEKENTVSKKKPLAQHWDGDWSRIAQVQQARNSDIAIVLEDLYQPHNAHAVIRICDGLGIGKIRIVERNNRFRIEQPEIERLAQTFDFKLYPTQEGHDPTRACLTALKEQGFHIAATTLRPGCIDLAELKTRSPQPSKIAFCFGTEEHGLSQAAHDLADTYLRIPMFGMTQSFNVSVSVALVARNYLGWPQRT